LKDLQLLKIANTKIIPPIINSRGTIPKRKTPIKGWSCGKSEKTLKITRARIKIKTIPAALVIQSSKISFHNLKVTILLLPIIYLENNENAVLQQIIS